MKLTWTYYPKSETESVTLTVVYVSELDKHRVDSGGFLDANQNIAYVNWETYKRFDQASLDSRKDAFARLTILPKGANIRIGTDVIRFTEWK